MLEESHTLLEESEELQRQLKEHGAALAKFLCEDFETFQQDQTIKELYDFSKSFSKIRIEEKRLSAAKARKITLQAEREKRKEGAASLHDMRISLSGKSGEKKSGAAIDGTVNSLLDGMFRGSFLKRNKKKTAYARKKNTRNRFKSISNAMQGEDDDVSSDDSDWESD